MSASEQDAGAAETLAREERWRRWAIVLAALAAALPLVGSLVGLHGLDNNAIAALVEAHARATTDLIAAILQAIGSLALAGAVVYLFMAVRARRPGLSDFVRVVLLGSAIVQAVARVAQQVVLASKATTFVDGGQLLYGDAHHTLNSTPLATLAFLGFFAQIALAGALVVTSLNAMRVGLLTRFMGVIGIFVGVLFILPIIAIPVVQAFWLAALAALFAGLWPDGRPPAWQTGRAEPWPSQQELREQRAAQRPGSPSERRPSGGGGLLGGLFAPRPGRGLPDLGSEPEAAEPESPARAPHPVSKKRKRKKRR